MKKSPDNVLIHAYYSSRVDRCKAILAICAIARISLEVPKKDARTTRAYDMAEEYARRPNVINLIKFRAAGLDSMFAWKEAAQGCEPSWWAAPYANGRHVWEQIEQIIWTTGEEGPEEKSKDGRPEYPFGVKAGFSGVRYMMNHVYAISDKEMLSIIERIMEQPVEKKKGKDK